MARIGFLLAMTAIGASFASTQIEWYPVSPAHRTDGRVTGAINNTPVTFEYFRNIDQYYFDVNYIRFAADGPVDVRLDVNAPVKRARLRTVLKAIPFERDDSTFVFTLPGPGHYYLQLPDLGKPESQNEKSGTYTVLFFVDDLNEMNEKKMKPDDPHTTVVTKQGVISHQNLDQTDKIQSILDGGGNIYFPAGIYRTGSLEVRANTTIYMEPGSILKAVDDKEKIDSEYIGVHDAKNVKIFGPGIIDANRDGAHYTRMVHIINTVNSRNLVFEDILIQNSISWALHIRRSDFVKVRNMKIFSGKDGIDPDSSSDVEVDNVCILAFDDAVAVKVRDPEHNTERVSIRNSIFASKASALKVGTETRGLMRDILFENCEVFDSDRGIIMYARDGGPIENVTWRNIHLDMLYWPIEDGGSPIQIEITNRSKSRPTPTSVRNCTIENVVASGTEACVFRGLPDAPLDGIKMKNITFNVPPPGEKKPPLIRILEHVRVEVEGLKINWQGNENKWAGVVEGSAESKINSIEPVFMLRSKSNRK